MRIQQIPDVDGPRRWFFDVPESQVMSAEYERQLLLELAECRRIILDATRRSDGTSWDLVRPDDEFRRAVHGLADGARASGHGDGDAGDAARCGDDAAAATLARRARRYEEIRDALALANLRLVAYIARRYDNRGIAPADLMQEGFCGLLEAIDRFDLVNETRLATYASWWIRQSLQRAVAECGYAVRLSPRQVRRLARSMRQLNDAGPAGEPSAAPASASTSGAATDPAGPASSPRHGRASWTEMAAIRPRISLDAVSHYDDCTPLAELLAFAPEVDLDDEEFAESVGTWLNVLDSREQLVVRLRYGLDGCTHHSLSEVGELLAVSKERVRQLQERALRKLREAAGAGHREPACPAGARAVHAV